MSVRAVPALLAAACAVAGPLAVADAAAAKPKFHKCSGTANGGDQRNISVRVSSCAGAIHLLEAFSKLGPSSVKKDGTTTVATLKHSGWVCVVRVPQGSKKNPSPTGHGKCTASKQRAILWNT